MFTETREMIDSTVYTNGKGEVTAQNINLAMHGMLDAVEGKFEEVEDKVAALEENGTGGGSGALKVWMPIEGMSTELTPEQIAENVATYNEIVKGEPVSVVLCQGGSMGEMTVVGTIPTTASYTDFGGNKTVALLANQFIYGEIVSIIGQLSSNGSVAMTTETFEVPASSGPLRVWISESFGGVLTDSQKSENASTYASIMQNGLQSVILMSIDDTGVEMLLYPTAIGFMPDVGLLINLQSLYEENGVINMVTYPYLLNADGTLSILEV